MISQVQSMAAASERVFEFLSEEEEEQIAANPVKMDNINGAVEFKNVQFGYKKTKLLFIIFSAKVKPGQKLLL